MNQLRRMHRPRKEFGRRAVAMSIHPNRRSVLVAMTLAAPLAGTIAAIVALYADSGPLGILVAAVSLALFSALMMAPGKAAS